LVKCLPDANLKLPPGASGIGRATVHLAIERGDCVVVADRTKVSYRRTNCQAGELTDAASHKELGNKVVQEALSLCTKQGMPDVHALPRALFLRVNITDSESVQNLIKEVVKVYGRVDYLIVTAAVSGPTKFIQDITDDEFKQVIGEWKRSSSGACSKADDFQADVDLFGTFLLDKYFLKQMLTQEPRIIRDNGIKLGKIEEKGAIVNISSALGLTGAKMFTPYG
jgi:NAD(P)-dependent dehydrogenase (short-subunit alcohol dehydrogenase family)